MRKYLVTLDEATADGARSLGEGNLSKGVRLAWVTLQARISKSHKV